jgi:hypothetical protein
MTLSRRIIPCLDTDGARVVKGVNFVGLRDAGDTTRKARTNWSSSTSRRRATEGPHFSRQFERSPQNSRFRSRPAAAYAR